MSPSQARWKEKKRNTSLILCSVSCSGIRRTGQRSFKCTCILGCGEERLKTLRSLSISHIYSHAIKKQKVFMEGIKFVFLFYLHVISDKDLCLPFKFPSPTKAEHDEKYNINASVKTQFYSNKTRKTQGPSYSWAARMDLILAWTRASFSSLVRRMFLCLREMAFHSSLVFLGSEDSAFLKGSARMAAWASM